MPKVKVKLLRPLDGVGAEGTVAEYERKDAERLASRGAVKILGGAKAEGASTSTKAEGASETTKSRVGTDPVTATAARARSAKDKRGNG